MVKIAVAVYSTYGHILALAKAEAEGVKSANVTVDVFQLPSGEPHDASASSDLPILTPSKLIEYDGVLFGIPSRFGTHPYAFKAFFDATGAQWAQGAFYGKYAGFFVTSGTQGGGQESVIRNSVTILAHHGMLYVPLGYARAFGELTNLTEVHGGSPWGAGSFAGPSGARNPSEIELHTARVQGKSFAEAVKQSSEKRRKSAAAPEKSEPTAPVTLKEPVAGKPVPDTSVNQPSTNQPSTNQPSTNQPSDQSKTNQPSTNQPSTNQPKTDQPSANQPPNANPPTGSPHLAQGESTLRNAKNRAESNLESGVDKAEDDYEHEPTKEKQKARSKFDKAIDRAEDRMDGALDRAESRAEKRVEEHETPAKGAVNESNAATTEKEKSGCCKCM